jgi:small subunit ribosomal protein S24e
VVDIVHPDKANASKADISKHLAAKYKVDERNVVVYGLKTQFGGGRSTGFALVYDSQQ